MQVIAVDADLSEFLGIVKRSARLAAVDERRPETPQGASLGTPVTQLARNFERDFPSRLCLRSGHEYT